jgi:Arc/MetJ family transcription regulator
MHTTIDLDDDLLERAVTLTGTSDPTTLIRRALKELIESESARRLARLGGTEPVLGAVPRRPGDAARRR